LDASPVPPILALPRKLDRVPELVDVTDDDDDAPTGKTEAFVEDAVEEDVDDDKPRLLFCRYNSYAETLLLAVEVFMCVSKGADAGVVSLGAAVAVGVGAMTTSIEAKS
jgi:hypothetical protein